MRPLRADGLRPREEAVLGGVKRRSSSKRGMDIQSIDRAKIRVVRQHCVRLVRQARDMT